ncbi:hypothetical protein G7062_02415 [Erysipelothrix sp. HDW6C]|uniref:SdrD B-like domain-containing protein n=1 Tax=Erysipelothrix sp. HDW6C TaxID=2714930 RepID=UPI00140B85C3|nr:SdrD B-like domain-containing protein [Erysipelothrix sp. HDW6C]QIK69211.1 hypothetical protein G7062_02415 [Erysipelothrix sp. HDW6C]
MKKIFTSLLAIILAITSFVGSGVGTTSVYADGNSSSNNNVTLSIPNYNPSEGWLAGTVYDMRIAVKFDGDLQTKKQVKITLPEGIRFDKIPVENPETIVDKTVDTVATWSKYIQKIERPKRHAEYNSYNGELIYTIDPSMDGLIIDSISVSVDMTLYYGPKVFKSSEGNGIQVELLENDISTSRASLDVNATGVTTMALTVNYAPVMQSFPEDGKRYTGTGFSFYRAGHGYTLPFYLKSGYLETPIPEQMKVHDVTSSPKNPGKTIINETRKVTETTYDTPMYLTIPGKPATTYAGGYFIYEIPASATPSEKDATGKYKPYEAAMVSGYVETYDGTILPIRNTNNYKMSHVVLDENDPEANNEKLTIVASQRNYSSNKLPAGTEEFKIIAANFSIVNGPSKPKKAQWLEYFIGDGFLADEISFPVSAGQPKPSIMYYRTSFDAPDAPLREAKGNQIIISRKHEMTGYAINRKSIHLQNGEYLVYAKAFIGDVGASTGNEGNYLGRPTLFAFGKLSDDPAVTSAKMKLKTWSDDGSGGVVPNSLTDTDAYVNRDKIGRENLSSGVVSGKDGTIVAGGVVNGTTPVAPLQITAQFANNGFNYSSQAMSIQNPTFYIRVPKYTTAAMTDASGLSLVQDSIVVRQTGNSTLEYEVSGPTYSNVDESAIYKVTTKNANYGHYYGARDAATTTAPYVTQPIMLDFKLEASIIGGGNYDLKDIIFIEMPDGNYFQPSYGQIAVAKDNFNVRGDGKRGNISTVNSVPFSVVSQKALLIDTYFKKQGSDYREPAYNPTLGNAVDFTAGSESGYYVDIMNNSGEAMTELTTYVPSPKTGIDFGDLIHGEGGETFNWDMTIIPVYETEVYVRNDAGVVVKLEDGPEKQAIENKYKVSYSNTARDENFADATFDQSSPNGETTMIRIKNVGGMEDGERIVYKFTYLIAETSQTIKDHPEKLTTVNAFRPYYKFKSSTASGSQVGTLAAGRLEMAEISGKLFLDKNQNGIFDAGDEVLDQVNIKAQAKNKDTGIFDGDISEGMTDENGHYKLDVAVGEYRVDFNDLLSMDDYEDYQYFTIPKQGSDDAVDSDVDYITKDDLIAGTVVVDSLDDVHASAISAGVLDYQGQVKADSLEDVELLAPLSGPQALPQTQSVEFTLTNILNMDLIDQDSLVWTSSDNTVATVAQNSEKLFGGDITAKKVGVTTITVTFKDVFGNDQTLSVNVKVNPNTAPEFTFPTAGKTVTFEAKANTEANKIQAWTDVFAGLEAHDGEDGEMTDKIAYSVLPENFDVSVAGTTEIIISVTDSDGNKTQDTLTVIVTDTTAPDLAITNNHLYILQTDVNEGVEASWVKEHGVISYSDIVTAEEDLTVTYTGLSSVNTTTPGDTQFSVRVVDEAGNDVEKTVTVTIVPKMSANASITLIPSEVAGADWKTLSGVVAYKVSPTSSVPYTVFDIDATSVLTTPGTYTLTITTEDGQTTTVSVVVVGASVENYDLYVNLDDVKDEAWFITEAGIVASPVSGSVTNLDLSGVDFTTACDYDITISVSYDGKTGTLDQTLKVHVLPYLSAKAVVMDAQGLTAENLAQKILTASQAVAYDTSDATQKVAYPLTLEAGYTVDTSGVTIANGEYTAVITAPNGETVSVSVKITEDATISVDSPLYSRTGTVRDMDWIKHESNMSWTPSNRVPTINGTVDYTTAGTYNLSAAITNGTDTDSAAFSVIIMDNMKPTLENLVINATEVSTLNLVERVGIKAYDLSNPLQAVETPVSVGGETIQPVEGTYNVIFTAADNTPVNYTVTVVETVTIKADHSDLYVRMGNVKDTAWIASEAGLTITPSTLTPTFTGTVDYGVAGDYEVVLRVAKSDTDFAETTITVHVVAPISGHDIVVNATDVAGLDLSALVQRTETTSWIVDDAHTAHVALANEYTLGGETILNTEGDYAITLSTSQETKNINVTVIEDLELNVTHEKLYVKQGDAKDASWIETTAGITSGPLSTVLSIDESAVDYATAGIYDVVITAARPDNSAQLTETIKLEVVPAMSGTQTLSVDIEDLKTMDKDAILAMVSPSAWNVADGISKTVVTSFTITETINEVVGTQTLTVVADNGETLSVTLTVTEIVPDLELSVANTTLYVKEGDVIDNTWIQDKAVVSFSPSNAVISVVGSVDTSTPGNTSVVIKATFRDQTQTRPVQVSVMPKMSVVNNTITLPLSELSETKILAMVNASAWNTNNPLSAEIVSVFTVENMPSTSGTFNNVVIKAANGESVTVSVTVVNDIVATTEYSIIADSVRINIHDLKNADFIALSNATGLKTVKNTDGDVLYTEAAPVSVKSALPETVGTYTMTLQAGTTTKDIQVVVYDTGFLEIQAKDVSMKWSEFSSMSEAELEAELLKRSGAKVVNTTTGEEYGSDAIEVKHNLKSVVTGPGTYEVSLNYSLNQNNLGVRSKYARSNESVVEFSSKITLTVDNDTENPAVPVNPGKNDGTNNPLLPGTGMTPVAPIYASTIALLGVLILAVKKLREELRK